MRKNLKEFGIAKFSEAMSRKYVLAPDFLLEELKQLFANFDEDGSGVLERDADLQPEAEAPPGAPTAGAPPGLSVPEEVTAKILEFCECNPAALLGRFKPPVRRILTAGTCAQTPRPQSSTSQQIRARS
eukprot:SAG11_NODE_1446_length_4891_cov_1.703673_4_plen_129_part_00